jgi:hypothetical protein
LTAYFAISKKDWSNENMGMHWLQYVFDRYTKSIANLYKRFLIVDGYNNYVNMRFINYFDQNRIFFAILFPHSTHRLQSLDIDFFKFLAKYYNQEIDRFIANAQDLVSISKRYFWNFFYKAYTRAFTQQNIRAD